MKVLIAGLGFITGDIPSTTVTFANIAVPPATNLEIATAVNLWKASETISRGNTIYNTNLGVPALGDQLDFTPISLTTTGTATVFNFGANFIYLTNIAVYMAGFSGTDFTATLFFESTGLSGVLIQIPVNFPTATFSTQVQEIFRFQGQFKLDGSQLWRLRWNIATGSVTAGVANSYFAFTTNPQ